MKALYILPSDLGCDSEYSERWLTFIKKFGWVATLGQPWYQLLVTEITIEN